MTWNDHSFGPLPSNVWKRVHTSSRYGRIQSSSTGFENVSKKTVTSFSAASQSSSVPLPPWRKTISTTLCSVFVVVELLALVVVVIVVALVRIALLAQAPALLRLRRGR